MRIAALAFALTLAACGQNEPTPTPEPPTHTAASAPWLICDAIDAPVLLVFHRDGATAAVAQYSKPDGALVQASEYGIGASEGAAGSVYTTLMQNGAEAGHIRAINAGMLETPASAFTPPYASVQLGEREISCRWLPRTRLMGFTGRRTIVVHEDQDGDLIYTSYDFAGAAEAPQIELTENARTTGFSAEVRGGVETTTPQYQSFQFSAANYVYTVEVRDGEAFVRVTGAGAQQSEPLIAFVEGQGPQE